MLGGMVLRWHWRQRRAAQGLDDRRPNLVMGTNTQICWDKFCAYFDVEARMVPISREHLQMTAEGAVAACDENTIGVVGVLGSTFDGSYEPIEAIQRSWISCNSAPDSTSPSMSMVPPVPLWRRLIRLSCAGISACPA